MPEAINKNELPQKICATCGRPFTWRKKWARVWDEIRYCSARCRRDKKKPAHSATSGTASPPLKLPPRRSPT